MEDCAGSFEDEMMQDAFLNCKGHAFVKTFLRLLIGASNESLEYSFQFPPFLANEDFIGNKKEQFLARVVYHVETTELASAPTIEILNFSSVSIEEAEGERMEKARGEVKRHVSAQTSWSKRTSTKIERTRAKSEAVVLDSTTASMPARPRLKKKLKKKKRKQGNGGLRGKAKTLKWKFIRAARYARKNALAVSETVQLIKLYALFMQSTRGDCPIALSPKQTEQTGDSASSFEGKDPLGGLKRAKVGR